MLNHYHIFHNNNLKYLSYLLYIKLLYVLFQLSEALISTSQ